MLRKAIIVHALALVWQIFLPCAVRGSRSYGCMEGFCAMDACQNSPGSQKSTYCYIAADSTGKSLQCGGEEDCRPAAQSWGRCKAFSCFAKRAPSPDKSYSKTCESMNKRKVGELQEECRSFSFEKWTRDYDKPCKIVKAFEPCVGFLIEDEAKKVIKYCFCYNSCGKRQAERDACTFIGFDRRLDLKANTASTYEAICEIDCEPTDKYKFLARLKHNKPNKASLKVIITIGTKSSRTTSSGRKTSFTVSAELGASVLKIFSAKLSPSRTTGFDWSSSSSSISVEEVKHEVSVVVNPGDEVLVYQVVGECDNTDGTKYTLKTGRYETKGKSGETLGISEIPPEEGSKWV